MPRQPTRSESFLPARAVETMWQVIEILTQREAEMTLAQRQVWHNLLDETEERWNNLQGNSLAQNLKRTQVAVDFLGRVSSLAMAAWVKDLLDAARGPVMRDVVATPPGAFRRYLRVPRTGGGPGPRAARDRALAVTGEDIEAAPPIASAPPSAGSSSGPAETTSSIQSVQRYGEVTFPEQVTLGRRESLSVRLTVARDPAASTSDSPFTLSVDQPVTVSIIAPNFKITGAASKPLPVDPQGDSDAISFLLTPQRSGTLSIAVDFAQGGRPLGNVQVSTLVVDPTQAGPNLAAPAGGAVTAPAVASTEGSTVGSVQLASLTGPAVPPDLELRIIKTNTPGGMTLTFVLRSSRADFNVFEKPLGMTSLPQQPDQYTASLWTDLSDLADPSNRLPQLSDDEIQSRLETIGNRLYDELWPQELKAEYWRIRGLMKPEEILSLLITSDEPFIPWELCKPFREAGEDNDFLCMQFDVARWLAGPGMQDRMQVRAAYAVVPSSDLASAAQEAAYITGLSARGIQVNPPLSTSKAVCSLLTNGGFGLLHFACHGNFQPGDPNTSAVLLADGPFKPSLISPAWRYARQRPLVFLNACHSGQIGFALTGLGGWARTFAGAPVGAFVGALWQVNDGLATLFATHFYDALLDNKTLGQAMRLARQAVHDAQPANSTYLAYVLYGDPEATVQVG